VKMKMKVDWYMPCMDETWWAYYRVQRLLRYVIPRDVTRKDEVAVAGSCALFWYQEKNRVGPRWSSPNDIDIFVCGTEGRSKLNFKIFLCAVEANLESLGVNILSSSYRESLYVHRDVPVSIVDYHLEGIPIKLSFVQAPLHLTIHDVVNDFDIDICRVVYHVHRQSFTVKNSDAESIAGREFQVLPVLFRKRGEPCKWEIQRMKSSMVRMKKYSERGFMAVNGHHGHFSP